MKKLKKLIMFLPLLLLSSCGNVSITPGNYHFERIHIFWDTDRGVCYDIDSWHDNENGVEVKLSGGHSLFISEGRYMLVEDYCPICRR